jgi:Putative beta-barrel porin-2, OmpL-like. bbp2
MTTRLPSNWVFTGLLLAILLRSTTAFGESTSNEELLLIIKRLEARIAELEVKAGKDVEAPLSATLPAGPGPEPTVAELKKDVDEIKKKETEKSPILDFFKQTQVTGYVDTYYGYNLNRLADQSVGLRGVNVNSNSFQFSAAKLSFNKPTTGPNTVGYRFDLVFGPEADSFLIPYEPIQGGFSVQRNVLNGYLSYSVPVGKGLTVDVGKFTTFIGAEVFDTIDNWNYQQGVLFSWAQPFYHTGLRASYAASEKVGLGFYVVNGWNNSMDNNTGKSLGFSLTLTPNSKFQLIQNYLGGPEKTGTNDGWRHLYDGVVIATVNKNVAL